MSEEERYLIDTIRIIQESYQKAAQPYLDRLAAIRAMQAPVMMVPAGRINDLIQFVPGPGGSVQVAPK